MSLCGLRVRNALSPLLLASAGFVVFCQRGRKAAVRLLRKNPLAVLIPTHDLKSVTMPLPIGAEDTGSDSGSQAGGGGESDPGSPSSDGSGGSGGGSPSSNGSGSGGAGQASSASTVYCLHVNFGNEDLESLHRTVIMVPYSLQAAMQEVVACAPGGTLSFPDPAPATQRLLDALVHHGALSWVSE